MIRLALRAKLENVLKKLWVAKKAGVLKITGTLPGTTGLEATLIGLCYSVQQD